MYIYEWRIVRVSCCHPSPLQGSEGVIATSLMYADAVWDRVALDSDELSFRVGDVVEILDMTDDVWWHGSVSESSGWFPASFVRVSPASRLLSGLGLGRGPHFNVVHIHNHSLPVLLVLW